MMTADVQKAPRISRHNAERIANEFYGLDVSAERLPSERDQNFLLRAPSGGQFVLKIANAESAEISEERSIGVVPRNYIQEVCLKLWLEPSSTSDLNLNFCL